MVDLIDKREFAAIMAVAAAAVGKDLTKEQARVYWGLLNDLPPEAVKAGLSLALLEHEYPTIPTVAMIRRLAVGALLGSHPTAAEAWSMVRSVIAAGGGFEGFRECRDRLPDIVQRVASQVGWQHIREARSDEARKSFVFAYRDEVDKDSRERVLPEHLQATMARLTNDSEDNPSDTTEGSVTKQPRALEEKSG